MMPRTARLILAGYPHHVIQRGNNKCACFYSNQDYQSYLNWLQDYANQCDCLIHAYVLMTNHVHLLISPQSSDGLGSMMRKLGQRYAQYINRTYQRTGTLWEGRYKSCITQEQNYVLSCYRYIELNPVRAGIVDHPARYRWSSYRVNAQGEKSKLISAQTCYDCLGTNVVTQQKAYRDLFRVHLDDDRLSEIRKATNGNYGLGSDKFKEDIELMLGRRARPGKPGRPRSDM